MAVNKLVYHIAAHSRPAICPCGDDTYLEANAELHESLTSNKNAINLHHGSRAWYYYKKLSNEYESVFTGNTDMPSSSPYSPVSRSFFKLWELMHDFTADFSPSRPIRAAFLAEGPGGFVEAFFRYRRDRHPRHAGADRMFGMTLHSADRRVPTWRLSEVLLKQTRLCRGADGTGSLYNPDNVERLVSECGGPNTCDLVTADGGFDFSYDFNNQEGMSLRLLAAEVHAALRLQRPGGTFLLKIYDVSCPDTMALMDLLLRVYRDVYVVKPLTSRPANSEKYLVCTGFSPPVHVGAGRALCGILLRSMQAGQHLPWSRDEWVLRHVVRFNHYFVLRQISYIIKTIGKAPFTRHLCGFRVVAPTVFSG
jgi:hypothetical protein